MFTYETIFVMFQLHNFETNTAEEHWNMRSCNCRCLQSTLAVS